MASEPQDILTMANVTNALQSVWAYDGSCFCDQASPRFRTGKGCSKMSTHQFQKFPIGLPVKLLRNLMPFRLGLGIHLFAHSHFFCRSADGV